MNKKFKRVKIELEVELPVDFNERKIDEAISDLICNYYNGSVIESKEYKEIK